MTTIEVFYQDMNGVRSVTFEADTCHVSDDGCLCVGDFAHPIAIFAPEVWLFAQKSLKTD